MAETVLIAHRGMDDTHPENTIPAFEAAFNLGMGIEFDIAMTSDGELVVIHDDTVDRTTDGTGRVAQMSFEEIRQLDAGSWKGSEFAGAVVPSFDEVLELVSSTSKVDTAIALDVKVLQPGIINKICDALTQHNLMARTVGIGVIARSVDVRRRFYEGSAEFQRSAVAESAETLPLALTDPYSNWIYARFVPSESDVEATHAAGKKMLASGDAVSSDVNEAQRAASVAPDALLTWHPTELHRRVTDSD